MTYRPRSSIARVYPGRVRLWPTASGLSWGPRRVLPRWGRNREVTLYWPVSPQSAEAGSIAFLFWLVMAVAAVFLFGVLGALLYIIVRFRGRPGQADPSPRYGSLRLELWWTLIPVALLVVVFGFMVVELNKEIAPRANALEVTVIGHQWWWEYRYPGDVVAANELHIPTGRQVRLNLQSADVIHTFWVPQLAG